MVEKLVSTQAIFLLSQAQEDTKNEPQNKQKLMMTTEEKEAD